MYKAGILIMSDKGARGEREDLSGPEIQALLGPQYEVAYYEVIPDERELISEKLRSACDDLGLALLLTSGGTGFSSSDVTPEATLAVIERLVPGIPEAMRYYGLQKTPKAMLSRAVAGIRGKTLIINLPGSVRGVRESLEAILPTLGHALDILLGTAAECGETPVHSGKQIVPAQQSEKQVPVVCIVSKGSNTGKTTVMENIIRELVRCGYRVGAVKSDCHGFEIDIPGKDSWRFAQAGAKVTAIIGPQQYALIQKTASKKELDEVLPLIKDVDIILVEGFKLAGKPKIEVVREAKGTDIATSGEELVAVVTDVSDLPVSTVTFGLENYQEIVDFIVNRFGLCKNKKGGSVMKVIAVNSSTAKGVPKQAIAKGYFAVNHGLEGDAHAGDWHRQVSLLGIESFHKMKQAGLADLAPGSFAENITTEGITLYTLPVGTKLKIGETLMEVTQIGKECHFGCAIRQKTGDCVMPREGIFAKVLTPGWVQPGDTIEII